MNQNNICVDYELEAGKFSHIFKLEIYRDKDEMYEQFLVWILALTKAKVRYQVFYV